MGDVLTLGLQHRQRLDDLRDDAGDEPRVEAAPRPGPLEERRQALSGHVRGDER